MTDRAAVPTLITGAGMVAALGPDLVTNCAAARAGVSRAGVIEHYKARSAVTGDEEPVIGHQAPLFTRGFEGEARLVRLAQGALADLLQQDPSVDWHGRHHQFYLSLPDPRRVDGGAELIGDEDSRRQRPETDDDDDAPRTSQHEESTRGERMLQKAARLASWPAPVSARFVSTAGHAGGLEALRAALADLRDGATDLAVVLGVDSLLDENTLNWLYLCGRLKCDALPAGLQPGEAAVTLAIVAAERQPGGRARIGGMSAAVETQPLIDGASPVGEGLAQAVAPCWAAAQTAVPWIVSDHNGEVYRAADWGHAAVRLRAQFEAFAEPVVWYPALSFGDTGAASALVGICTMLEAWARRYAPAPAGVVASASDGPQRAALTLVQVDRQ